MHVSGMTMYLNLFIQGIVLVLISDIWTARYAQNS